MSIDFVPTRASLLKGAPESEYEEVSFVAYKSKKKPKAEQPNEPTKKSSDKETEFNMRKAKYEIMKFGMSGFDPEKKEEAKIRQLISLGAKPPKNKYKNYKQLMAERKLEKQKQESEQKFQQLGKNVVGKSTAKGKSFDRKRRKEGILDIYGKIVRDKTKGPK
ncbi:uncharacterized protein C1orf131 homolog [Dendroctonus ponderosae]